MARAPLASDAEENAVLRRWGDCLEKASGNGKQTEDNEKNKSAIHKKRRRE